MISNNGVLAATRSAVPLKRTWISALLMGALSLVQLAMMIANRNPKVGLLSDANIIPWVVQFFVFGLLAIAFFKGTLDKIGNVDPLASTSPFFLNAPTRDIVLGVAAIMVGVAVVLLTIAA